MDFKSDKSKFNKSFKRKGSVQHWFVLIMSFLLVIAIILLVIIFKINVTSSVVTGNLNMQYSTDAGREIYALLSSGCPAVGAPYTNYDVEEIISVYISGDLTVKESLDTPLRNCIRSSLATIAEVNEGMDKEDNPIPHYMYFYVTYGNQKYLEDRRPTYILGTDDIITPWNVDFTSYSDDDIYPKDPRYFSSTMNDRYHIQIPLADSGNMQHNSATAVLEEWSDEPWTTLTQSQQEESA